MKVKSKSGVAQLCPTPSDPMDCSLPGSSVHGIHKACGAANDSCSQEGPGEGIAEMNSKHNRLKEPIVIGEFPQILYEKLKKKRYWRRCSASLITTGGKTIKTIARNQIPPVRVDIHKSLQTVNVGESQELIEPQYKVGGNGRCRQPPHARI